MERIRDTPPPLIINRTAIDLNGRLGSLYDGCQDEVLRVSDIIFEPSSVEYHQKTKCILVKGDRNHKRNLLELINIDEQLRLSLLLNLTPKHGLATIVDYSHTVNEYTRVLHYLYIHREERLPNTEKKIQEQFENDLSETDATHIITGISWGINIVIVLQLIADDKKATMVDATLEKYRAYLNSDSSEFRLTRDDLDSYDYILDTAIYSNIPVVSQMTTLHTIFHSISCLRTDEIMHQQLSYILYPIPNSDYVHIDSMNYTEFDQYVYELSASVKIIKTCFNEDIPNLLCGHFKERFANAYKQWSDLKNNYKNLMERFSNLLVEIRSGVTELSTLKQILNTESQRNLKTNASNLLQNVIDLNRKGHLISDLGHQNIQYCNVVERNVNKNDSEDTLKRKLMIDEKTDRILCSNDILNKNNSTQLKKLRNYLIDELQENAKLRLIYADFSYSTYELHDMIILPPIGPGNKKKKSKHKGTAPSIDTNGSTVSLPRTNRLTPSSASKLSLVETINILLLGEIGVGKSTFINGIVNYLTFQTFDKALSDKPIVVIPVSFFMTVGDSHQKRLVKAGELGSSSNENFQVFDRPVTQNCASYVYYLHNNDGTKLRLIDTPGLGDKRGVQQDDLNIENILDYIKKIKYLNAICILLKPNESRLNTYFQKCLTQLFDLLGPNARKNVIFCFTNTRSTVYTPGNTAKLFQDLLLTFPVKSIPFKKKNIFSFDNDSFRYLVALQNKIHFNDKEKQEYETSWSTSVQATNRLIRYIRKRLTVRYVPNEYEFIRSAAIEIVEMIHPMLETIRNLFRQIIHYKMNQLKELSEVNTNESHLHKLLTNADRSQPFPTQPMSIDFLEEYKMINNPLSQIQNDMIDQLSLLCHVNVEFAYFLLYIARYSHSDPFLDGFLRIISEENIICENRNRNYTNLQLVEGLKKLASSYKHQLEITKSNPRSSILSDIYEWIKFIHKCPLISQYVIDNAQEHIRNETKVTSI